MFDFPTVEAVIVHDLQITATLNFTKLKVKYFSLFSPKIYDILQSEFMFCVRSTLLFHYRNAIVFHEQLGKLFSVMKN